MLIEIITASLVINALVGIVQTFLIFNKEKAEELYESNLSVLRENARVTREENILLREELGNRRKIK